MKTRWSLIILLLLSTLSSYACTTAIIAGRASKDGRPLLYKQRDTGFLDNKVMIFEDGLYKYIGIVNADDKEGKEVWGGHNQVGFAIMNSASYNLNPETKEEKPEREGIIMKLALQKCKTLKDFETLLDTLPKPMFLSANFGVIDAKGGAAYYETGDYGYTKFDVNQTKEGYLIRTNYSYSGDRDRDLGLSRDIRATALFHELHVQNDLSHIAIHQKVSRNLHHGITNVNLYDEIPKNKDTPHFVPFRDYIPRYSTSSSIIVQGVSKLQAPSLTTMWTILGSPLTTVTIPLLITPDNVLPQIVQTNETGKAPICTWGLQLKENLFPITKAEGKDYLDLSQLITQQGNGILQEIEEWEKIILIESTKYLSKWEMNGRVQSDYTDFYKWIDDFLTEKYTKELNIKP